MPPRPPRGAGPRGGAPPRGRGGPPGGRGGPPRGRGGPPGGRGGPPPPRGSPPARAGAVVTAQATGGAGRGVAIAEHIQTIGERKRGYGREGRPIEVYTNHFAAEISDSIILHYDGQLRPSRFDY
jgi:eukaryotic translation initiation factor 2C